MKNVSLFLLTLTFALGLGQDAFAYIGPGAGLSMLGAFWGLVVAVFAALSFLLLWSLRRMFKKKNASAAGADADVATDVNTRDKPAG
jgi:membrane protein implicated in regulation of membrane protease activity